MGRAFIDLTGQRFTDWTVLGRSPDSPSGQTFWICRCVCGTVKSVNGNNLRGALSKGCGCNRVANVGGYDGPRDPTRSSWSAMRTRCLNPNSTDFSRYGGAGVGIDPRWDRYENFLSDMGPRPTVDHTLDRADNRLGYSKGNCRWATRLEQCSNRTVTVRLPFQGRSLTYGELEKETGINKDTIRYRVEVLKMTAQDAVDKQSRFKVSRVGTSTPRKKSL